MSEKISVDIKNLTEEDFIKLKLINLKEWLKKVMRNEVHKELEKYVGLMVENNEEENIHSYSLYQDYIRKLGEIMIELGETNSKKNLIFDFVYNGNRI